MIRDVFNCNNDDTLLKILFKIKKKVKIPDIIQLWIETHESE